MILNADKTWVEISKKNLLHNVSVFRNRITNKTELMAVIKANAYGHGLIEVASIIQGKIDWFGVDSIDEAIIIRQNKIAKPIMILGFTPNCRLGDISKYKLTATISSLEQLKILSKFKNSTAINLKVETGTGRQGIHLLDLPAYFNFIKDNAKIKLIGLASHFANIEDTSNFSYAKQQIEQFKTAEQLMYSSGFNKTKRHIACSAAALIYNETHSDIIRMGIGLYGLWPSAETKKTAIKNNLNIELKPVLTWKTIIAQVKDMPAESYIGYGCSVRLKKKTKIAILPIGYFDGYDRGLGNKAHVLVRGVKCPILGRICMNMCIIDVSKAKQVQIEDEVVLIGQQKANYISVEQLANWAGTVNYEIVTRINPLIKRTLI